MQPAEMIAGAPNLCPTSTTPASWQSVRDVARSYRQGRLLGEASHGTAEFYRARAAITRRLIEQHGFTIVAVEADWPDAAPSIATCRHRCRTGRRCRRPFQRFPTWMWRNTEVARLRRWMRALTTRPSRCRIARRVLRPRHLQHAWFDRGRLGYLDKIDPQAAGGPRALWVPDALAERAATYGRAVLTRGTANASPPS